MVSEISVRIPLRLSKFAILQFLFWRNTGMCMFYIYVFFVIVCGECFLYILIFLLKKKGFFFLSLWIFFFHPKIATFFLESTKFIRRKKLVCKLHFY